MRRDLKIINCAARVLLLIFFSSQCFSENYYWIGGSGNWSDINHWAQSSGGSVLHIQIPTSEDDVFFDENSFTEAGQSVTVNTENAICRSMDWTGAQFGPVLTGSTSNNLRVFGSVNFIQSMTQGFGGTVTFESSEQGNVIFTAGHPFNNHVYFDGVGGSWEFADDIQIEGNLYLVNGSLGTGGYDLDVHSFYSTQGTERGLDIKDSHISTGGSWDLNGEGMELSAANSFISVNGNFSNQSGDTLAYNQVDMNYYSTFQSSGVWTKVVKTTFHEGGKISGTASSDTLLFNPSDHDGIMQGNLNVIFAELQCTNNSIIGANLISRAQVTNWITMTGSNEIGILHIDGNAGIYETNLVVDLFVSGTSTIEGENTIGTALLGRTSHVAGANDFENCLFNCDGYINGYNTFDTLTFSPGFRYFLGHSETQTIQDELILEGTCQTPIFIKSSYNGLAANLSIGSGGVPGEYLSLRDIHINGPGPFLADHSVDLGNNEGWTIETSPPRDLYWVGGQGNWDDTNHWSDVSGGPGGQCPPTEIDRAIFDGASLSDGESAIINVKNAVCDDLDWTACQPNTALSGPDTNYQLIYGSLYYSDNMTNDFMGETQFEAIEEGKVIDPAGNSFNNNLWFQGRGGEWMLADHLVTTNAITHTHGDLHTHHHNVHAITFSSPDTNARSLFLYSDTVILNGQFLYPVWYLNGENCLLDADSSVIVFNGAGASMVNANHPGLVFNNVHFLSFEGQINNYAYSYYNLVTFSGDFGTISQACTIDSTVFYGYYGLIQDNDSIGTAIFHQDSSRITGNHVVGIAYFYGTGEIIGHNRVDTALFYSQGLLADSNMVDTAVVVGDATIEGNNQTRTMTLRSNGYFIGDNSFDELYLEYSKVYSFQAGSEQTIVDTLSATGRCTGPLFLISDENQQEASLRKVNGTIDVEYANIRDIKAVGPGVPFHAYNSVDLGGNTGWEVYQHEPEALYWVGNSGNWSDSLHWASESGGEPGYCIPSPIDDVYFDHNSFSESSTVHIDVEIAACHNMNWTGAEFEPSLAVAEIDRPALYIFGSLTFIEEMTNAFSGPVHFTTTEKDHTIASAGNPFIDNILFNGPAGSWHLEDDLLTLNTTRHIRGDLHTEGHSYSTQFFYSSDILQRGLFLDTSTVYIGDASEECEWLITTENLTFDADSSHIVSYGPLTTIGNESDLVRYNDIDIKSNTYLEHIQVHAAYDDVFFESTGEVIGNCTIDTLQFAGTGNVMGSDTINFARFMSQGYLNGGEHMVNTAIFESLGSVTGNCMIGSAIFHGNGTINGMNIIDTTIFYMNGNIQGSNTFNSQVVIYQDGTITGSNTIEKDLTVHGTASIYENNLVHHALLLGWGYLGGPNEFNILTFTPGKTYILTASTVQTVHDTFNIRGNNCYPITLRSTSSNGVQAGIYMPGGQVTGDFIVMKDIAASGGASFYAGGHSDDISNNTGWIWDNAPGYIYGLGEDVQFFCDGETLVLSTENFNGNPNTVYQWSDGSIGPTYQVTEPGVYGLTVYYSDDCAVSGEITAEMLPTPEISLGEDAEVCEGESIALSSGQEFESYLWNDSTTSESLEINQPGTYWLEVTNSYGCTDRDTIMLETIPAPQVDLGENTILRHDETIILDAGYPGGTYLWSTGETTQTIVASGMEGGKEYSVEVEYKGCLGADTILVDAYPYCTVDVPTAFSPNGDGTNDSLYVYGSGVQHLMFRIYDRFGALVFESERMDKGWGGEFAGKKQGNEVYLYYLKAICFDGLITEKKGNITLLR